TRSPLSRSKSATTARYAGSSPGSRATAIVILPPSFSQPQSAANTSAGQTRTSSPTELDDPLVAVLEEQQQEEIVFEMAREEKVGAHVLPAVLAQLLRVVRRVQQLLDPEGGTLDRVREDAAEAMRHLQGNAADGAGDHRLPLPQGFAHSQAESLLQRLLQH